MDTPTRETLMRVVSPAGMEATFAGFCNTYRVIEKTVPLPTRVKVLERV